MSELTALASLQRLLAIVLEDYYHERGHDYEHDAAQLSLMLYGLGLQTITYKLDRERLTQALTMELHIDREHGFGNLSPEQVAGFIADHYDRLMGEPE